MLREDGRLGGIGEKGNNGGIMRSWLKEIKRREGEVDEMGPTDMRMALASAHLEEIIWVHDWASGLRR
uniref:Uncharacterized protein n=1 Tax=Oryza glumipatula TaxID=40148 RepID=A0A0D9ZH70_9ORYZ